VILEAKIDVTIVGSNLLKTCNITLRGSHNFLMTCFIVKTFYKINVKNVQLKIHKLHVISQIFTSLHVANLHRSQMCHVWNHNFLGGWRFLISLLA
jgi:hypothetical protein